MTMSPRGATFALNPLQWFATEDGWLDRTQGPDLPDLLRIIKENGFDAIHTLVPEGSSAREYGDLVQDAGLSLVPGTKAFNLAENGMPEADMLEIYRKTAEQYAELGLRYLFIQNGMRKDAPRVIKPSIGADFDQARLDAVVDLVTKIGSVTSQSGVLPLLLDNISPDLLGFGPDTGHILWGAGVDPADLCAEYSDRVFGVHVKDCRRSVAEAATAAGSTYQEAVMNGVWVEPGRGDLDFDRLWAALPEDYSGCLVVEVDRGDIQPPLESVRACAAWAKAQAA
jgi:inosose dehydratase